MKNELIEVNINNVYFVIECRGSTCSLLQNVATERFSVKECVVNIMFFYFTFRVTTAVLKMVKKRRFLAAIYPRSAT